MGKEINIVVKGTGNENSLGKPSKIRWGWRRVEDDGERNNFFVKGAGIKM